MLAIPPEGFLCSYWTTKRGAFEILPQLTFPSFSFILQHALKSQLITFSGLQDFVFRPGFLALWPGKSGEVEVTLRSRGVGKYNALLEAMTLHIKSSCEGESCFLQAFAGKKPRIFENKNIKEPCFPIP